MPELRIGYVLKRFPRFSETFILNELLALEALGVELEIYSLKRPPEEPRHARLAELKAPVTYLGKSAAGAAPADADAALFAGQSDRDVTLLQAQAAEVAVRAQAAGITHLHAHFGSDATTVALLAARRMGGTFSFTAHARDIYHTYVSLEADAAKRRVKLRAAAFVVTVSDHNAAHLSALCPEAAGRIHRLYNGVDLTVFAPPAQPAPVPGRIIAVGRLVEKKGFADLIAACGLLRARGAAFDCHIVGDGPLQGVLADLIATGQLQDHIHLDGPVPQEDLARLLDRAAIAALPCIVTRDGDRDGLPTVLLEAMAKGLPVVTTTVTGGPEIVADGETGLLCPPGSPAALADMLQVLIADPGLGRAMGRAGRRRAERLFDLRTNAAALLARFRAVTAAREEVA